MDSLTKRWISDLSASFRLFEKVDMSLGGNYKVNTNDNEKIGGFAEVSYAFAGHFTFHLRFRNNYYDDYLNPTGSFDEYILNGRLVINW